MYFALDLRVLCRFGHHAGNALCVDLQERLLIYSCATQNASVHMHQRSSARFESTAGSEDHRAFIRTRGISALRFYQAAYLLWITSHWQCFPQTARQNILPRNRVEIRLLISKHMYAH